MNYSQELIDWTVGQLANLSFVWIVAYGGTALHSEVAGAALSTLQTAAIIAAFPFSVIMVLMCVSLYIGMSRELKAVKLAALSTVQD